MMSLDFMRDFRDLLIQEINLAAELTVWAGGAQVDPEKCSSCGLCVEIGHCNAIILTDAAASIDPDLCPKKAIHTMEKK
jgi:MinD superfamily P-loop ATPase